MPSKLQNHYYDIAAKHKGMVTAKDPDHLVEGEYSNNINMLVRNGEMFPVKGETYMSYEWTTAPTKMITYQTDRDASGDLNTTQWLVWNDTSGKIYRGVLTSSLASVSEILDPDGNSFNITVKQFLVIHQDLLFHQGHNGEAYLYGYREVLRHPIFLSTVGWQTDRIATQNPAYLPYTSFQSGQAYSDGAADYIITIEGATLRKHNLNANGTLGALVWSNNLENKYGNLLFGGFQKNMRIKVMGVNTATDEVFVMFHMHELASYVGSSLLALPYKTNLLALIWVFDTDNGKFSRQLNLGSMGGNSWGFNDATLRYDDATDQWRIYAVGSKYTGTSLTSNYLMMIDPSDGSLYDEHAFTFSGTNMSGAPAIGIDVAYSSTAGLMVALITGWDDNYANDPSTVECFTHGTGDPPTWTYRSNETYATPAEWWTNGGVRFVNSDTYGTTLEIIVNRSDGAEHPSRSFAKYVINESTWAFSGSSLTTITFHQYFTCVVDGIYFDQITATEFMCGKVSADGATDLAWVDGNAAVQSTITQLFQISVANGATASSDTTKVRYRYAYVYDKEYSILSPDFTEWSGAYTSFKLTLYANRAVDWRRVNRIDVFRADWDDGVKDFLEYKLVVSVPLTGEVTKITLNNLDWDYASAGSNYAAITVEDGLELLTDGFESLSGFPEDIGSLDTRYSTAIYANNRLYVGSIWLNNEILNDRIGWSPLNGLAIPSSNWLTLTKGDPDQITALQFHEDWLMVGKQNALFIYDVTSYEPAEWFEIRVLSGVGVIDNDAIAATPHGVFFYGNHAVYQLDRSQGIKDISTGIVADTDFAWIDNSEVFYDIKYKTILFNTTASSYMYDLVTNAWSHFHSQNGSGDYIYQVHLASDATNGKIYMCGYDSGLDKYRLYELFNAATNVYDISFAPFGRKNSIVRFRELFIDSENITDDANVVFQYTIRNPNGTYSNVSPTRDDYIPILKEGQTIKFRVYTNDVKVTVTDMRLRGLEWQFIPTRKRVRSIY